MNCPAFADNDQDKLLVAKINDMLRKSQRSFSPSYSFFLDERQCALAEKICTQFNNPQILFRLWGGFADAKRKMLCVFSDIYPEPDTNNYPFRCLSFSYKGEKMLSHRDFLGSLMALRLKREAIGDIIVEDNFSQLFATDAAAQLILSEIHKIGNHNVTVRDDLPLTAKVKQDFTVLDCTVSSMRTDCIIASALNLSREKSAALIHSGCVQVNFFSQSSVSCEMKTNDVFSVRGFGKFIIDSVGGITKKGRIHIKIRKYI